MKNIGILILLTGFISCSNIVNQEELEKAKLELAAAKTTIENLKSQIEPEGDLVHVVLLKTKFSANLDALGSEIEKLRSIEVIKDLQYGAFENLGDKRALSDYSMMMEMSFDNEADYQIYQKHPLHLKLINNTKLLMAGPPATYDYMKK